MERGTHGDGDTSRRRLPHHEATEVVKKPRCNTHCSLGGGLMESNTDSMEAAASTFTRPAVGKEKTLIDEGGNQKGHICSTAIPRPIPRGYGLLKFCLICLQH